MRCIEKILVLAQLFILLSACAANDFPETFPDEWKTMQFREKYSRELTPGVNYYRYYFDSMDGEPLSLYYVIVDWDKANVKLKLAECGGTLKTVMDMVKAKNPIAATNGAYFHFSPPSTYYPLKIDGVLHTPEKTYDTASAIVFNEGEFPRIVKQNETEPYANVIQGYQHCRDGKFIIGTPGPVANKKSPGTPFTAVGLNPGKRMLVLFVNDGRHKDDSPGIDFTNIGRFLVAVGCTDVVSIDGGGSSTMIIRNENGGFDLVNRPSDNKKFDHEGARRVHNCLYLTENNR